MVVFLYPLYSNRRWIPFLFSTSGQIWSIFGKSQSRQEYRTTALSLGPSLSPSLSMSPVSSNTVSSEADLNRHFWLARETAPPSQNRIPIRPLELKSWKSLMNSLNVGRFFSAFCFAISSAPMTITPVDDLGLEFPQLTIITVKLMFLLWRIFKNDVQSEPDIQTRFESGSIGNKNFNYLKTLLKWSLQAVSCNWLSGSDDLWAQYDSGLIFTLRSLRKVF